MTGPRKPAMSDAEAEVLSALWDHGPGTVRAILDLLRRRGRRWTRSTVITLLQRLERKGYVESDQSGFAFVFRAAASREEVVQQRLDEVAEEFFSGQAAPLLMAFADRHQFTADEVAQFRKMIDELEVKAKRRKPKR